MYNQATHLEVLWNALVENHALTPELVSEMKATLATNPWTPLGSILVSQGFLKLNQVSGLLEIQSQEPNQRIGDLAVREGYCTQEQIERALSIQQECCPGPIDLVLRTAPVKDELVRSLVKYIYFLEGRLKRAETKVV